VDNYIENGFGKSNSKKELDLFTAYQLGTSLQ